MSKVKGKELWQAVKEILFREWDPIGINSNPSLSDEYDSYASGIVRLFRLKLTNTKLRSIFAICSASAWG